MKRATILLVLVLALAAAPSFADPFSSSPFSNGSAYAPAVPVSAFAQPASWFDPSRLHVSTLVSVGSGWTGQGTNALQLTHLTYQFGAPLWVRVGVGNTFGSSRGPFGGGTNNGLFFEGFEVAYRPNPAFQINLQYQDVRSPLQLSPYPGYSAFGR